MKLFTSRDLENGNSLDSDKWYLNITYIGTPYEAFTDIPFITNSQSKIISEESVVMIIFDNEEEATAALEKIKNNEYRINKFNVALMHQGELIDNF